MIAIAERAFALLALVAAGVAVGTLLAVVAGRIPATLRDDLALPLATAVAAVATAGSLF